MDDLELDIDNVALEGEGDNAALEIGLIKRVGVSGGRGASSSTF